MDLLEANVRDFYPAESEGKSFIFVFSVKYGEILKWSVISLTK